MVIIHDIEKRLKTVFSQLITDSYIFNSRFGVTLFHSLLIATKCVRTRVFQ